MTFTKEQAEALQKRVQEKRSSNKLLDIIDAPKAKGDVRRMIAKKVKGMNKTEAEYAGYLDALGIWWQFEPIKLRLADNCYFIPDFLVMKEDGLLRLVDCKAWWRKAGRVGVEDDALVKLKTAAEMYPIFEFVMTWKKDGVWEERIF